MIDCEAEFFVKDFIRCGCAEVVETEYHAVSSDYLSECRGQTGSQTERGNSGVMTALR